jgi:hypothetical protein
MVRSASNDLAMGRRSYLGGSSVVGPWMERFRSKQTIEDRARELDAEKKKQWDQQLQAEREAAGEELQALLKRQEAAAAKVEAQRAASALRVGPKKSRLTAAERRIAKLRSKYPSVIDEADLLFGKPE